MGHNQSKDGKKKSKKDAKDPKAAPASSEENKTSIVVAKESPGRENGKENGKENGTNTDDNDSLRDGTDSEGDPFDEEEATIFSKNKQIVTKDDFELLTVIGKGSFGKVMQVRKKDDGKIYAMKVLRKDTIIARKQVSHTKSEKNILMKIQHPFIVNLNYAFQTKDKLYMILDYINGGELFFHLKKEGRFAENRVKLYAAEIASAVSARKRIDIVTRAKQLGVKVINGKAKITTEV